MTERTSRFYEVCAPLVQGNDSSAVVRQTFPMPGPEGDEVELVGDKAREIIDNPDRVLLTRVRNRLDEGEDGERKISFPNHFFVVRFPGIDPFTIDTDPTWQEGRAERVVADIEAALCSGGLTIVLDRGIVERPVQTRLT